MKVPTIEPLEARIAPATLTLLSPADSPKNEGTTTGGTTDYVFKVKLDAVETEDVTVTATAMDGTATLANLDFQAFSQVITIPHGQLEATFIVKVNADSLREANETFSVQLSAPSANATLGTASAEASILNDDPVPTISIADASVEEGNSGDKLITFRISLSNPTSEGDITFDWKTALGSATAGVDYIVEPGATGTIVAGQLFTEITVHVLGDTTDEVDEHFFVNLSNAKLGATPIAISDGQADGRIQNDDVLISITGPTDPIAEGLNGTTTANFTISIPDVTNHDVTVSFHLAPGTATAADGDYQIPTTTTVTIPAGQKSVIVPVSIVGDNKFEPNETFAVVLDNPQNAAIGTGTAEATILNDDLAPTLSIADARVEEGNDASGPGVKTMVFRVSLTNPASEDVTFHWSTQTGTADSLDFVAVNDATATISAGASFVDLQVQIIGDTTDELDEQLSVHLSNALLGAGPIMVTDGDATGTIINDELTVRISGATITEGHAGSTNANFTVSIQQISTHDVTVNLAVVAGTATEGVDYTLPGNLTVTIPAGQTSAIFSVPVLGDTLDELNETFGVNIITATNAKLGVSAATGTIVDDDAPPTLSISDASVLEGDTGTKQMAFTISLSAASGLPVTVVVTPTAGTASAADYTATTQTITIPAGETSFTYFVDVTGDVFHELDETIKVTLSSPTNATILDGQGIGTILDDDATPTLSIGDVTLAEGDVSGTKDFVFTVTLSAASNLPVTFKAQTVDGTALAGSDYTALTQTLTIPAGQTSATFTVKVAQDSSFEPDENFTVQLSDVTNATVTDGTGLGTITNDDVKPTLKISDVIVDEGNGGTDGDKTFSFTVTLSAAQNSPVTFDWIAAGGTATLGSDYVAISPATITIPAGETTAKIQFKTIGDTTDEPDETFQVTISNALEGGEALTFTDDSGQATIRNDEHFFILGDVTVMEGDTPGGLVPAVFVIKLNKASTETITVKYQTQEDSATSTGDAADYIAIPLTEVTFLPGETEKTVTVMVKSDVNFDGTDKFKLRLSEPTNASTSSDDEGIATILEEATDVMPTISIDDVSKIEDADATDGKSTLVFTLHLNHASDDPVDVFASTLAGTALAGLDFTAVSKQKVTFAPGTVTQTFSVEILDDTVFEKAQDFKVVLSSPANGTIGDGEATGTILPDADAAPTIKVTSVTTVEGNSGQKTMNFVVTRTGATDEPITFTFETVDAGSTATAGTDYIAIAPTTYTLAANETTKTVAVQIIGDTADEVDETINVKLTLTDVATNGATLAAPADGLATGTILNDDLTVSLQQTPVHVIEGNSGQANLVFTVVLSAASTHDTIVNYTVAGGTATVDVDFVAGGTSIVIPAGQTTGQILVPVNGDVTGELDETVIVTLNDATNAELATNNLTATGTIDNDDAAFAISDAHVIEGANGVRNMVFTVTLGSASVFPVTVNYATQAAGTGTGFATEGTDYTAVSGTLTFQAGETSKQILVPIFGDTTVEGDETFQVVLSQPQANGQAIDALVDATGTGTIQDDEAFLSINDFSISEGDNGTKMANFTVTLTPSSSFPVTVRVSTQDGTAISTGANADFVAKSQVITFAAGETTKIFSVVINGDKSYEQAIETYKVLLTEASGALVVDGEGLGTITDSGDTAPTISVSNATLVEGDAGTKMMQFTVSLSEYADSDVTFTAATALSTAANAADAADFTALAGTTTFTIPAGQKTFVVEVPVLGDTTDEADEVFNLKITDAKTKLAGGSEQTLTTAAGLTAIGTILNDDLKVSIDSLGLIDEGDTGSVGLGIKVRIPQPSLHAVTVTFTVGGGTATAGTDYTVPTELTVTIPIGATEATITIPITGDTLNESNETFNVTLTGAANAQVDDAHKTGVVTITDNDPLPTFTVSDATVAEGNNAVFTVTLNKISGRDVIIKWVTKSVPGSATPGDGGTVAATQGDYQDFSGTVQTLTIPAGSLTGQILVKTVDDADDELAETFKVQILDSTENATVPADKTFPLEATGTISTNDLSTFSVADVSITEGASGTKMMSFTVTRSGSAKLAASVHYHTVDGSAKAGTDFVGVTDTVVTFDAGQTSRTVDIMINGDNDSEIDESFFLQLDTPVNATIADGSANGVILNDEVTYKLVPVGTVIVPEEGTNNAAQFVEFKVIRSGPAGSLQIAGTVFYSTGDDPATGTGLAKAIAGADYTVTSGSINFTPTDGTEQEATIRIKVPILADTTPEGDETFVVKLTSAINGAISTDDGQKVITITDNDGANLPQVIVDGSKVLEGGVNGTNSLTFTLKLVKADGTTAQAAGGPITVTYELGNGTATAGSDFTAPTTFTVTFAAGETQKTVTIPILGDTTDEADETVPFHIVSAKYAIAGTSTELDVPIKTGDAVGTIRNDDLLVTVNPIGSAPEGNGDVVRTFTISIPQATDHDVTVYYTTQDGTAVSTGDYADFVAVQKDATHPKGMAVTIPAGQTSATFSVTVKGDTYAEGNEAFNLLFSDPENALLADGSSTVSVSVLNDDAAPSLSIGDATIVEGNNGQTFLVFNVVLAGGIRENVTVDFKTVDGIAKSVGTLADFTAKNGTVTFLPSANGGTQPVMIAINGDTWKEIDETFTVELSNAKLGTSSSGVTITDATATGTILDDGDTRMGVSVQNVQVVEGASGTTTMNFIVETTSPVTGSDLTFKASTRNGTAKAGTSASNGDFTALTNSPFTIAVGQSTVTVPVSVFGDTVWEASEFFFLDLKGFSAGAEPVGGSGGTLSAYGTILTDDVHVISSREFEFVDEDGDIAHVKFSKGSLNIPTGTSLTSSDFTFVANGSVGGRLLQKITLSDDGFEFENTSISVTAKAQVLVTGAVLGNSKANVGAIDAAILDVNLFQVSSGVALGNVTISGDLGRIIGGSVQHPKGASVIKVGSFGAGANLPAAPLNGLNANSSFILGPLGRLEVAGDFVGSLSVLGDSFTQPLPGGGVGKIKTLIIKGALRGGDSDGSGQISFTAGIGSATIGSIVGGAGRLSASILPIDNRFNTAIGSLTVLGDISGGAGDNSAFISTGKLGSLAIGKLAAGKTPGIVGDLTGGTGEASGVLNVGSLGKVLVNGDLVGGSGKNSGSLLVQGSLGTTRITGDLQGGDLNTDIAAQTAESTGFISTGVLTGKLSVEGSIIGGSGASSGVVFVSGISSLTGSKQGNAPSIVIGSAKTAGSGNIIGKAGASSGRVVVDGNLTSFLAYGNIEGGLGASSGNLQVGNSVAATMLKTAVVKGSIIGGGTEVAGPTGAVTSLIRSGYIEADRIGSLTVEGMIKSGTKATGTTLAASGGIFAATSITTLKVLGVGGVSIEGNEDNAVVITALQKIGNLTFAGSVKYAEVLAGYTAPSEAANARGTMRNAGATIDSVTVNGAFTASSIVAGVYAGTDGVFGTADDDRTTNGTTNAPGNQALISRIAKVILAQVPALPVDPTPDPTAVISYGIVADNVKSVKANGAVVLLVTGPTNDPGVVVGPADAKLKVFEV
jgi:hypothetical protein